MLGSRCCVRSSLDDCHHHHHHPFSYGSANIGDRLPNISAYFSLSNCNSFTNVDKCER